MKKFFILMSAALVMLAAATSCDFLEVEGDGGSKNAVDLGLSVKWATCNLGASSPEQSGGFYAWGETKPKTSFGSMEGYKWSYPEKSSYGDVIYLRSKYNSSSNLGKVDNKTKLDIEDDAAHVKLGGKWRMPTRKECQELIDKCTWTLTSRGGVDGFEVKSKANGNSIFLPFTGFYGPIGNSNPDGSTLSHQNQGNLWVSDMDNNNTQSFYFKKGTPGSWWGTDCTQGLPIRPVSD